MDQEFTKEMFDNVDAYLATLDEDREDRFDSSDTASKEYDEDLYKKWFRSKTQSGFLSIRPWFDALKLKIDIGKTSADGKLISSTNVFVDACDFAAYLKSLTLGTGPINYPSNERMGVPTDEGFVSYGGSLIDGKPISRIFKSHHWQNNDNYDTSAFAWKCGHFQARKSDSGAFIPDMSKSISVDMIKVTRSELATISYKVDLALTAFASSNSKSWYYGR
jgi:hypothetical protein